MPISSIFTNTNYFSSYLDIKAISVPSSPGSGIGRLFHSNVDGKLYFKKSNGTVVDLESGGGVGATTYADLTDVNLTSLANGDIPIYNSSTTDWENAKIANANISNTAAIAYSKLDLSGSIVNADVSASAAIVYSKLTLTNSIVNADINASAAIATSKLADGSSFVTLTGTQTLTNKTLTTPIISSISNSGTITLPTTTTTLVGRDTIDTLTNKTISGASNTFSNINYSTLTGTPPKLDDLSAPDDNTDLNSSTTAHGLLRKLTGGTTNFLREDGAWAAPPGSGGGGGITNISDAGDVTFTSIQDEDIIRYDNDNSEWINGKLVNANIDAAAAIATSKLADGASFVTLTGSQTLTNKTLTSPIISTISNTGTLTLPTATTTLVGRSTTDTLTNKTLTTPIFDSYTDLNRIAAPSDPGANVARIYHKQKDVDNDGIFAKYKVGGAITEVELGVADDVLSLTELSDVTITSAADEHVLIHNGTQWVNRAIVAGDLPATVALTNAANTFTAIQKINVDNGQQMTFYRPVNTGGFGAGFYYNFNTSTSAEATYGFEYVSIESNTNGSHRGDFNIQLAVAASLGIRFRVFTSGDGGIIFGNNQRLLFSETGQTGQHTFTLPDATTELVGDDTTQTLTNKTLTTPVISSISNTGTVTFPTATTTLVGKDTTDILTNKAIDADGTGNSITNIENADIKAAAGIVTTKLADSTNFALTTRANSFGDFANTFKDDKLKINNPADTFAYTIVAAAIAADRNITLPLLTGNDTIVTEAFTQTLTNKTVNSTDNTITATSQATGDILKNNGTKFVRMARGTGLQVLRTNSGATDLEWASLDSERTGLHTASGNGSTTLFNIAHGLGSTPTYAFISVAQSGSAFIGTQYTVDGTNIAVTFTTAPASGSNNVKIYWRVVA